MYLSTSVGVEKTHSALIIDLVLPPFPGRECLCNLNVLLRTRKLMRKAPNRVHSISISPQKRLCTQTMFPTLHLTGP